MDQILEGTLRSDKPNHLKRQLCHKVEELGCSNQKPTTVHGVLDVVLRLSLEIPDPYIVEACKKIYLVWGKHNRAILEEFFTPIRLQTLLDARVTNQKQAIWFIHETMLTIRSDEPPFLRLCKIIQLESVTYLTRYPAYETVTGLCRFMTDFRDCIPRDGRLIAFCNSLITAAGTFEAPKIPELMKQYIMDVTYVVGGLLSYIWKKSDVSVTVKSLHQIFSLISHLHENRVPSLALAGTVPHIPTNIMDSVVKQTVSDINIPDVNIKAALARMLDWLTWPAAKHLDSWIIAFFKGLASVHKYTILMEVVETKIEHVYEKLHFIPVRESAFMVLAHMLLSYQHSPEPFHKIVQSVPRTIMAWRSELSEASYSLMCKFSHLLHTLMAHHLGFPDLYEPVLNAIKDLPCPSSEQIKESLEKHNWKSSQRHDRILSVSSTFSRRSETGKTGLINLGNTCYMNSVLQALYMCDSFRQEVLASQLSKDQPLLAELRRVFAFLSATQRAAYAPSAFLTASRPPWFTAGLQQDCSEFMRYLYDQMHEEELAKLKSEAAIATSSGLSRQHTEMAENQYSSLISQMFMGKIMTMFKCLSCHHESKHVESFTDLSLAFPEDLTNGSALKAKNICSDNQRAALVGGAACDKLANHMTGQGKDGPLKNVVTLEDLLKHYLRPEKLKGDNKYYCDVCRHLQDGIRFIHIISPPEYLNLTLLRFAYNVKAKARSKIFTDVTYPKSLHIPVDGDEVGNTAEPSNDFIDRIKKSKTNVPATKSESHATYALCAVIVHSGLSSDSGHYYCYARHSSTNGLDLMNADTKQERRRAEHHKKMECSQDLLPDQWYLFNDSRVTYSRYESFCNITKTFGKDTPYVLFYKRIHPPVVGKSTLKPAGDVPFPLDLRAAVDQDNRLFLQEQELAERSKHLQASTQSNTSFYKNWKDPDDKGPPGSCGGGGGGGGFSTNRLVF